MKYSTKFKYVNMSSTKESRKQLQMVVSLNLTTFCINKVMKT